MPTTRGSRSVETSQTATVRPRRDFKAVHLVAFPPKECRDDWVEFDLRAWPEPVERHSMLVPTTCFNCESARGRLAYVDRQTLPIRKLEGNPEHSGSRGRNCVKNRRDLSHRHGILVG